MKLNRTRPFRLEKMYFDCIDEDGNCFILYWSVMEIRFLRFIYSGLLFSDSDNTVIEKFSFKKTPRPGATRFLTVENPLLNIKGEWWQTDNPIYCPLLNNLKNGDLNWDCHHPKAESWIEYNGKIYRGYGYAETLFLSIKPWNLPFEVIKWGHFMSEKSTIIWIQLNGEQHINNLWYNGKEYNDGMILEDRVIFNKGGFVLLFQNISTLREGEIIHILPKYHIIKALIKKCILNGNETKYKAESIFTIDGETFDNGWSLYETVTWKK